MDTQIDPIRLYSINDVADRLNISYTSVSNLIGSGKMGFYSIGTNRKISGSEILRYLSECLIRRQQEQLPAKEESASLIPLNLLRNGKRQATSDNYFKQLISEVR